MTIYGTRPEAIKMAPLIAAIHEHPALEAVVAVTGQHREMLDQVNELFGIVPDHDLDLMTHGATLAAVTSRTLTATTDLLERTTPELVVVQGEGLHGRSGRVLPADPGGAPRGRSADR